MKADYISALVIHMMSTNKKRRFHLKTHFLSRRKKVKGNNCLVYSVRKYKSNPLVIIINSHIFVHLHMAYSYLQFCQDRDEEYCKQYFNITFIKFLFLLIFLQLIFSLCCWYIFGIVITQVL
jgi:hypothetical protein